MRIANMVFVDRCALGRLVTVLATPQADLRFATDMLMKWNPDKHDVDDFRCVPLPLRLTVIHPSLHGIGQYWS